MEVEFAPYAFIVIVIKAESVLPEEMHDYCGCYDNGRFDQAIFADFECSVVIPERE